MNIFITTTFDNLQIFIKWHLDGFQAPFLKIKMPNISRLPKVKTPYKDVSPKENM